MKRRQIIEKIGEAYRRFKNIWISSIDTLELRHTHYDEVEGIKNSE